MAVSILQAMSCRDRKRVRRREIPGMVAELPSQRVLILLARVSLNPIPTLVLAVRVMGVRSNLLPSTV